MLPERKILPHEIPSWVETGADYFITICAEPKGVNLLLLMPDHLHAIMSFSPQADMQKSITDWKRYTCISGGIEWQRDFFDHRLRKDESYLEKAQYIRINPVRAGFIDSPDKWPLVWSNR